MGFKERLREEIEYRGILIKELSAAVGISNSTFLSYIDARGVLPNVETAVKIARALNVSVEYLVTGETQNPNGKSAIYSAKVFHTAEKLSRLSERDFKVADKMIDMLSEESN